ncbi:LysM peptidoglycan-binding domain-containing protein [Arthrobacter sp. ISL-69]|uniref:LysM peptidoglycan-binding domain-containing protein n=1 Tax=Arthrobacter sp. ISL-69 TaxID=2819113 RepID=UPI001BE752A6|nr:LysM peptidoglycan-binding domain-containing protein [Arthrobacter sp. ISL-69]MBT2536677.1 LysM peptidoglycan-binding domain-containing protein [Arthrobacter sp. ISL-69]
MKGSQRRPLGSDAALAAAILLLGTLLAGTGASLVERWQRSAERGQSLAFEDLLGIAVNTIGLIIVAWWFLSMLIALASAALERTGNGRAAEITGKFSPAFMRRLALAAVGLQLLGAPLAHGATDPGVPPPSPTSGTAIAAVWAPTEQAGGGASALPSEPAALTTAVVGGVGGTASISVLPATSASGDSLDPQWKPSAPVVDPGPLAAQPVRSARQQPASAGPVTVVAGDSLWSIAARGLGGSPASDVDVALEWPRWYQANRAVVGDNPDVLLPGQVLRPPSSS